MADSVFGVYGQVRFDKFPQGYFFIGLGHHLSSVRVDLMIYPRSLKTLLPKALNSVKNWRIV